MRSDNAESFERDKGGVPSHLFDPPSEPEKLGSAWRDHIAPFFAVSFRPETDLSRPIGMKSYNLGEVLVGDVVAPAHVLDRTEAMIRQQGLDHILLQFYRSGRSMVECSGRTGSVWQTHCVIFDLAQPVRIIADPVEATNVVIPRALLEDQGCRPETLHGHALDHDGAPFGRLLHAFLSNVVACGNGLSQEEALSAARSLVQLCGTYLREGASGLDLLCFDTSVRARLLIERELGNPALTPALIASRLQLSRASLYRHFDEAGGVIAYIRDRRLMRAMRMLVRGEEGAQTVATLAQAVGFPNENTFQRAFRRRFGFLPDEAANHPFETGTGRAGIPVLRRWIDNL